jgi:hypothetical protein
MNIKLALISLLLVVVLTVCGGKDGGGEGCPSGWFSCADGLECVDPSLVCDQQEDCADGSDELNCGGCSVDEWECTNQQCVLTTQVCDGVNDCADGSDEESCDCDPFTEFECTDSTCIDIALRCDGNDDCRSTNSSAPTPRASTVPCGATETTTAVTARMKRVAAVTLLRQASAIQGKNAAHGTTRPISVIRVSGAFQMERGK